MRCTFVGEGGQRCEARAFLELDHVEPRGLGGSDEPENLRVRCRAHNQLWAEQSFGRGHVAAKRHFCQKKYTSAGPGDGPTNEPVGEVVEGRDGLSKVRFALEKLGFTAAEARHAVAVAAGERSGERSTEELLRDALQTATQRLAG